MGGVDFAYLSPEQTGDDIRFLFSKLFRFSMGRAVLKVDFFQ